MAWFRNYYKCERCGGNWVDEWSSMCDDDCSICGARHMSPYDSDDQTEIIDRRGKLFVVIRSPVSAGHAPDYADVASFPTLKLAEAYLRRRVTKAPSTDISPVM
jgi:hypothetical protein